MVPVLTLTQYPIQKIINGDSVVIMTTKQGREINYKFERQKKKITDLNKLIDSLKSQISYMDSQRIYLSNLVDSLNNKIINTKPQIVYSNDSLIKFYQSKLYELDTLKHWLVESGRRVTLLFLVDNNLYTLEPALVDFKRNHNGTVNVDTRKRRRKSNTENLSKEMIIERSRIKKIKV